MFTRLFVLIVCLAAPVAAQAQGNTLAALVGELERNNPELKAAAREIDMEVARIAPAGTPPDPTVRAGYMSGFTRPPFFPSSSTPDAFRQFGVSQEFPYPGKLALRSRIAAIGADVARWNYEDRRLRLSADVKASWFEYVYLDRSLAIVRRNKEVLDQFRRIAEARFSVGKGAQQDLLKAQLEISMLLERIAMLERERRAVQARVNGLLYRAPDSPIPTELTFSADALPPSIDELRARLNERNPAVRRDEQIISRGQQSVSLARREFLPDFAINVTGQRFVGGMPWMYGLDFMVKVPIFWKRKQRPMVAEATAALESAQRMRENTIAMATADLTDAYAMATTSRDLVALYSDSVVPQARLALESSVASYEVGAVDFLTLLSNFSTVLNYEIGLAQQQARYHQALAKLEPLVGAEFIR